MCCGPVGLAFDPPAVDAVSRAASALTHYDPRCRDVCVVFNRVISALVDGDDAGTALDSAQVPVHEAVADARDGVRRRDPATLSNSGFVVHTLAAGLHHGLTAPDAETAVTDAVSMGGDADTLGAVAGAVAGARFGASSLPDRWLDVLDPSLRDGLGSLAETLRAESLDPGPATEWTPA
jgi:ADP-ribosyl-[dinitrogen reductase] hydrolase